MTQRAASEVIEAFWKLMQTNDFRAASSLLSEDYELTLPQSSERVSGRDNFTAINQNYPAQGRWQFVVNQLVAEGNQVVTDVSVTDGVIQARAITFSTVKGGLIVKQLEFWPESYEAPAWRRAWVERD